MSALLIPGIGINPAFPDRQHYAHVEEMLDSPEPPREVGAIWNAGPYTFEQAGANETEHHITTDGGAKLFVRNAADGTVSIQQFGRLGNSVTGDDAVLRKAIDFIHNFEDDSGTQGTLVIDRIIHIASPVVLGKNITLRGLGANFRSGFKPLASFAGDAILDVNGDAMAMGDFAFRVRVQDLCIDSTNLPIVLMSPPLVVRAKMAYQFDLVNVKVAGHVGRLADIDECNFVVLRDCKLFGRNTGVSDYGVIVRSAGPNSDNGGVIIDHCDIEMCNVGILTLADARVTVIGGYLERCQRGWEARNTSPDSHLTILGVTATAPSATAEAAYITAGAHNVTVIGGTYVAGPGKGLVIEDGTKPPNLSLIGVNGDIVNPRNFGNPANVPDSTRWNTTSARKQGDLGDGVATPLFAVTMPFDAPNFAEIDVHVMARDNAGYSTLTANYRFNLIHTAGTLSASPLVEYGRTEKSLATTYGLAVSVSTQVVGSVCTFSITADSTGQNGAGQSPRLSARADMINWESAGNVYLVDL